MFLSVLAAVQPALATDFVVTKGEETRDGACDSDCSLREAVIAANANPGPDVILLPAGIFLLRFGGFEDNALLGDLDLLEDTEVRGAGVGVTLIDASDLSDSAFEIHLATTVVIEDLTISGSRGGVFENSGSVNSSGDLTLRRCQILEGDSGPGAAVRAQSGSLDIESCTFAGNESFESGGAIATEVETTITNSTITGSTAANGVGGGLYAMAGADVTIKNSTFTGNSATTGGGGVAIAPAATVTISNSVIAGNTDQPGTAPDCAGGFTSSGFNLVGIDSGCFGFSPAINDQVGTAASPLDPVLAPLSRYGGGPMTHLPLLSSPLIDTGSTAPVGTGGNACEAQDQRGSTRPFDGDVNGSILCDIGAVEAGARILFADSFEAGNTSAWDGVVP